MNWRMLCFILLVNGLSETSAQTKISDSGMEFTYKVVSDSIRIEFFAPTKGWVAVGFNDRNSIVKSDLMLFHVVNKQVEYRDMYVVAAGNPKEDKDLGGTSFINIQNALENERGTQVSFSLPLRNNDRYDYPLEMNKECWLILAYSTHDEFDHHSRVRKHFPFKLSL